MNDIPNSKNSIFEYNKYSVLDDKEDYITSLAIVSEKERETISKHWDEIQYKNELQFEQDYINSVIQRESNDIEELIR